MKRYSVAIDTKGTGKSQRLLLKLEGCDSRECMLPGPFVEEQYTAQQDRSPGQII